jgi:putative MATE family efflux protein
LKPISAPVAWSSILMLAIPVSLQMLLQSLLGITDVLMVGHLGTVSVAAVGLASKIHFLMLVLMSGMATGASVLIAQFYGANDKQSCQKIFAVTVLVSSLTILPFVILFGFFSGYWVSWINPDPEVAKVTATFLIITAPVLLLTQWTVIHEASLRALGHTTMPLVAGIFAAVLNIFLNYILINGHMGFPALGVAGAAWATLIARLFQLIFILFWVYASKQLFALTLTQWKQARDAVQIRRYVKFSTPLVANYAIWALGNSVYHLVTGFAGTQALAVMGVIVPVESAFFALFVGLSSASAVLVGRELGAGNLQAAWDLHKFFDRLTYLLLIVFCSALWFLRPYVVNLFNGLDEESKYLLMNALGIFCVLVFLKVLNMIRILGVLRAGGDNKFTLITDTLVMWGVGLPVFIAAVFFANISFLYLYALLFLEDALKFIPVIRRVISRKWMNNLTLAESTAESADIKKA